MTTYIWSIDDAGTGKAVESMGRTCEIFDSHGIKSTWFTVPKANDSPMSPAWHEAVAQTIQSGHDIQLHGLSHADCYEFGPPAWPATSILGTLQSNFETRREELMPRYTVDKLQARLEEGMEIFKTEFGITPVAFRAPCGAISKPFFKALRNVGIGYHSSVYISGTGYQHLPHNSGSLTQEWSDDFPHQPFVWYEDIIEAPILNEYTWRGAGKRSNEFIELAKQDIDRIAQESPIAVLLMHTHGIDDDYEHTVRLIEAVAKHVGQHGGDFATFNEVIQSGTLAAAAVKHGADVLTV